MEFLSTPRNRSHNEKHHLYRWYLAIPESDTSTHILRIARGISSEDAAGNKQLVFYDWGVGSDGNPLTGGATGRGIDMNILDCYRFLVYNYDDGDAVYLFGFSWGPYTVRSLAGLIGNCGILRREHAGKAAKAYSLFRQRSRASAPGSSKAAAFRRDYAVPSGGRVHFVGGGSVRHCRRTGHTRAVSGDPGHLPLSVPRY